MFVCASIKWMFFDNWWNIRVMFLCTQVACALLMAGENIESHADVKNILIEMGTYFQVQVTFNFSRELESFCYFNSDKL